MRKLQQPTLANTVLFGNRKKNAGTQNPPLEKIIPGEVVAWGGRHCLSYFLVSFPRGYRHFFRRLCRACRGGRRKQSPGGAVEKGRIYGVTYYHRLLKLTVGLDEIGPPSPVACPPPSAVDGPSPPPLPLPPPRLVVVAHLRSIVPRLRFHRLLQLRERQNSATAADSSVERVQFKYECDGETKRQ